MKYNHFFMSLLGSLTLSTLTLFPQAVKAQVQVSPMVITTETEQGQASGVITLNNQGSEETRVRLVSQPFTYDEDGFKPLESSPDDLSPYLVFSPKEVVLAPGQERRVRLFVRLLPSTPEHEYRAVIFAEPLREITSDNGITINTRIAVTVYVRHGNLTYQVEPQNATYNRTNNSIGLSVRNTGTATVRPLIRWSLNRNGQQILTGETTKITVINQSERNIPIKLEDNQNLQPGEYQLTGELVLDEPNATPPTPFSFNLTVPQ